MIKSTLRSLFVGLIVTQLAGCTTMQSWRSPDSDLKSSAKTKSSTQGSAVSDADEEDEDDSVESAVDHHTAELILDEPPDPWFGKYNYADKGRAIERNLR